MRVCRATWWGYLASLPTAMAGPEWTCAFCTFSNPPLYLACGMCGSEASAATATAVTSDTSGAHGNHSPGAHAAAAAYEEGSDSDGGGRGGRPGPASPGASPDADAGTDGDGASGNGEDGEDAGESDTDSEIKEGEFVVQEFVSHRYVRRALEIKVKWRGYSPEHDSFEPVSHQKKRAHNPFPRSAPKTGQCNGVDWRLLARLAGTPPIARRARGWGIAELANAEKCAC